ncbi:MAG TPA: hypothetical protein VJU85_04890 [Nitrososphaeraceae archaeon]|jgi:hypothetical protein|nr:hypothetical protein [Nitrososphaeraceae archaeon]
MDAIHDLDRLVHKGARTNDGFDLGNVIAVNDEYITIQGKRIYKVPIKFIDLYNGSEVFLNIPTNELNNYKIY